MATPKLSLPLYFIAGYLSYGQRGAWIGVGIVVLIEVVEILSRR